MNTDEKLFALMGLADEQSQINQALLKEFAHVLKLANDADREELKKERERIIKTYISMSSSIEKLHSSRFYWITTTFFACSFLALIFVGGSYQYVGMLKNDITVMRETISSLKSEGGEAEVYSCEWKNVDYPCVRVMTSWKGRGSDKDIFIIDPK